MGQKQSVMPVVFYCPETGDPLKDPLAPCNYCQIKHELIWQLVYVCPNTGYRIEAPSRKPQEPCLSCFQAHHPVSKRAFICPVTGAQIPHPRTTGGKCSKCSRTHLDSRPLRSDLDGDGWEKKAGPQRSLNGSVDSGVQWEWPQAGRSDSLDRVESLVGRGESRSSR